MTWIHIQHAARHNWDDYQEVGALIGDEKPEGLIVRAVGEVDGRWKSVGIWESKEAYERFVEARFLPAVRQVVGEERMKAGPPPEEWFEAKHVMGP